MIVSRVLLSLLVSALAFPAAIAQEAPELIADSGRTARAALGGEARTLRIDSAVLGQTRHIDLVLPASFARSSAARRYPVLVVLDGESSLPPVAAVSAELASHGLIPECIVVAIRNEDPFAGRVHDLTPPGISISGSGLSAGGDRFLDFIERELLPAVDRQFRGGAPRVLVGHSSGGILATWAAATRPGFAAVVAVDAPVQLEGCWLAQKLIERAGAPGGPLRYAFCGARFAWRHDDWAALTAAAPASWLLRHEQLEHEGHETVLFLGAYLGLREVFADYSRLAPPVAPTTSILPYYETLAAAFGASLVPPERLLRDVTEDLLIEGRGADARAAYVQLVDGYGAPAGAAELLARIADVESRPPPAETVESLLATPFPTPEEAQAFLGDWVGDLWMGPAPRHDESIRLRIRVVDGRVTGETVHTGAPGGPPAQTWQYMRVTPEGLTWGYLNGMRPRGVVLFEGRLQDATLSGRQRFGGIDFRPEDGADALLSFSFRRVAQG